MKLLNAMLRDFVRTGTLRIVDADGHVHVHAGSAAPDVTIRLTDPKLHRTLFLNPELKAGEAYMDGTLIVEKGTLRDFLTIFALNRTSLRRQPLQRALRRTVKRVRTFLPANSPLRSRRNVAHHYDLSNEMYALFLDDSLTYSCGYFRDPADTLETAQRNKLRHIAAKLALRPGQRILDIGSGWGGMAIYLAEAEEVEVLGVTLSVEQQALATRRAAERGLSDRVRFALTDYRAVEGTFDRIVSVGMFEHVGTAHYDTFFRAIHRLLADDGVALLHSIGRKGGPGSTGAWIRKYIFPGGYSPALSETLAAVERAQLWTTDIEIWRLHYAKTLACWSERFAANRDKAAALLGERFCRMWEFYLLASELSFSHGKHMVFQMQLAKSVDALPLTRDPMHDAETRLAAKDRAPA